VLAQIHNHPWVVTSDWLNEIIARVDEAGKVDLDAVAAKLGRPLENAGNSVEIRNGVAILGVTGPLFRYANLMTELSGASSIQTLARDFQTALDNPQVKHVLLDVDSPGGQIDGVQEFADQIRAGSKIKPVTAYVDHMAASAGYWIAAAAPRIVAVESALLGSIGVVASLRDNRAAQERQGVKQYEIVSSKSPLKRTDPATDDGRAQILKVVDALAEIFIGRVAALRGVSTETVESRFGQGSVMIAADAVAAGMADEIGSFEPLVARLAAESAPRAVSIAVSQEVRPMADNPNPTPPAAPAPAAPPEPQPQPAPVALAPAVDGARVQAERQRIAAILDAPEAKGREWLARALALETDMTPEAAKKILAAAPTPDAKPPADPLAARMAGIQNPAVGTRGPEEDPEASEAQRILAFVPKDRRHNAA
jgi:signal peptide peptidase SppA